MNTTTPQSTADYEEAKADYLRACNTFATTNLVEIRRLVAERFPTATSIALEGAYGDDGEFKINLTSVRLVDGATIEEDDEDAEAFEELAEAIEIHLLYLARVTGEDYLGEHDEDIHPD